MLNNFPVEAVNDKLNEIRKSKSNAELFNAAVTVCVCIQILYGSNLRCLSVIQKKGCSWFSSASLD